MMLRHLFIAICLVLFSLAAKAEPIDINMATAAELAALQGIGQKRAAAIVSFREAHGPFQDILDLVKVPGIGPKLLEANSANLKVSSSQ